MTSPAPHHGSTAALPLHWGHRTTRLWAGGWLILGGGLAIAGSNTFALWLLALGTAASIVGWAILPAAGWRRTLAVGPATFAMWLLLTGPRFVMVLAIPYLCWLLVRHRAGLSALTVIPVIAVAIGVGNAFGQDYSRMLPALGIVGAAMVGSAWLARLIPRRS